MRFAPQQHQPVYGPHQRHFAMRSASGVDGAELKAALHKAGFKMLAAEWCGFCKKLVKELEDHGIDSKKEGFYVECGGQGAKDGQCDGVTGFPTLLVNGQKHPGYKPAAELLKLARGH